MGIDRPKTNRSRAVLAAAIAMVALLALAGCSSDDKGDDANATTTAAAGSGDDAATSTTGGDGGATTTTAAAGPSTTLGGEAAAPLTDVATQLQDADLGCDAVSGQRTADGAQGAAQCDLSTDNPAYLYTFTDDDQRDAFIDNGGVIDCTFLFGSGVTFKYVVADGVIIRPEANQDAQALADALGGEVRTLTCELPDDAGG